MRNSTAYLLVVLLSCMSIPVLVANKLDVGTSLASVIALYFGVVTLMEYIDEKLEKIKAELKK